MKQFLVLIAVLPLLLIFLLQFSLDQQNHTKMGLLSDAVYVAKEKSRQSGCFTNDIQDELRSRIARILGTDASEISIVATEAPVYRISAASEEDANNPLRGLIYYRVTVPIGPVMAGSKLFGVKESNNMLIFDIESYTTSELIQ